jgi:hypothetical protein
MSELTKVCTTCKVEKPISEFHKKKCAKSGVQSKCKVCRKEYDRQYYSDNAEEILKRKETYYMDNIEYRKQYCLDNAEEMKEYKRHYKTNRYHNNIEFKILDNLRTRLHAALKGASKSASTVELLGCTSVEFKDHLESQFTEGMTWGNHGTHGWHMDHIRPCASFDLKDPTRHSRNASITRTYNPCGPLITCLRVRRFLNIF